MGTSAPPDERLYSIQQVARLLDLRPATLRAWERRFGVPQPRRAANGYRLYSQSDLELLGQLKAHTDGGLRIGHAVESLTRPHVAASIELDRLRYRLGEAILRLDERRATLALRQALALHPVETVLESVVEPMLTWIGDEWRAGHVSVGAEHFASALFVRQLVALYLAAPDPWRPGRTLAACVPGDQHEIGLLTIAVGLHRRGWDVLYFGADLPFDELLRAAAHLEPAVILLSATHTLDDDMLGAIDELSPRLDGLATEVVLGGLAVRNRRPALHRTTVLNGSYGEVLASLETVLTRRTHANTNR
jgi:DNA-binding transcriptional MerR regulator/methylmalonyl-CoA mutase cobalamin-binding subunit